MDKASYEIVKSKYNDNRQLIAFWDNLKKGYDLFEKNHQTLSFTVDSKGKYVFE